MKKGLILVFVLFFLLGLTYLLKKPTEPETRVIAPIYSPAPLILEEIFPDDHGWIATLSAQRLTTIIATGDVIPARAANYQAVERYKDILWPWKKTADFLRRGDITFINLETPLFANCMAEFSTTMVFCGSDKHLEGLLFAGVDVVTLANNHAGNYGQPGINSTKKLLEDSGVAVTGVGGPTYKTVKGIKFAFLGYNDIETKLDSEKMTGEISQAKKNADVVMVAIHWGTEYRSQPDERQRQLAHLIIDSGADLIIGNHPHWIQSVELYKGKLIAYAHGNFIFDQEWSEKTKLGVVGKYTFYDKTLVDVQYFPVKIMDFGQPYFLEGKEKEKVLEEMRKDGLKLTSPPN